jgi:uncharacterized protein
MPDCVGRGLAISLLVAAPASVLAAPTDVTELQWAQLVPPAQPKPVGPPKTFYSGSTPATGSADSGPPPPPLAEGKWMSTSRHQPGQGSGPPLVVAALDGKRVRIGGYVVPLDFESTSVKEFLLVPFVGACIHVPPPPANQIIYVKAAKSFDVSGPFDPVYVTGTLKTAGQFTGLAETGYTIDAETVDLRK